ncbi:tetratricopeptide repeat protein [Sphingobacteriales bacterium UPWRP_1]|nr:hypothetical protein BVG80_01340 [Sphingobacteriales bacterium TSM_CSM]PSJ72855.1 tetratricopeptide repeat protein [Sphingobacteriales bacterium UPWRP_1]
MAKRKELRKKRAQSNLSSGLSLGADKQLWWALGALLLLTLAVYAPHFGNELITTWDDGLYITENPFVKQLNAGNFKAWFTQSIASNYHPLTIMSLAIDYRISELSPQWYHFVSLVFHLLNTVLVFVFVQLLTNRRYPFAALLTAGVFALHPMHVESVAWISERKDVLYTAFFLLSLICYLRYLDKERAVKWYVLCFVFFVLSVLSKPSAVVLPVVLLLIDYYRERSISVAMFADKLLFLPVSVAIGLATVNIQSKDAMPEFERYSFLQHIQFASYSFMAYIAKMFAPFNLSALHPYPALTKGSLPAVYQIAPAVAVLFAGAVVWSTRKTKLVLFGVGFYLINIVLVLQFFEVGRAIIAERYTYLSYVGLTLPIAIWFNQLLLNRNDIKTVVYRAAGVVLLLFAIFSFQRAKVWKNSETLWTDVIEKYPRSDVAYDNRGVYYRSIKQNDKALADYNKVIEINPQYPLTYNNRANIYFDQGKDDLALPDYNKALELDPDNVKALTNRALIFVRAKQYNEADRDFNKAIELDPNYASIYFNRGIYYDLTGQNELALKDFDKYLQLDPKHDGIWNSRGVSNQKLSRFEESIADFSKAMQINGKVPQYYLNRSYSYNALDNKAAALQDALKARQMGLKIEDTYLQNLQN